MPGTGGHGGYRGDAGDGGDIWMAGDRATWGVKGTWECRDMGTPHQAGSGASGRRQN